MLLGDLNKDGTLSKYEAKRQNAIESNSPATMYGAPIEMKANNGPMPQSGLNYGTPLELHGKDHETSTDEFGTEIPEGFKADAKGVTGFVRPLSSTKGADTGASTRSQRSQLVEGGLSEGEDLASGGFGTAQLIKEASQPVTTRENLSDEQKKAVMQSRSYSGGKSPKEVAKILNITPTITTVKVDE
jgi:hypothetical protein